MVARAGADSDTVSLSLLDGHTTVDFVVTGGPAILVFAPVTAATQHL